VLVLLDVEDVLVDVEVDVELEVELVEVVVPPPAPGVNEICATPVEIWAVVSLS
jgi:hypothetical protein